MREKNGRREEELRSGSEGVNPGIAELGIIGGWAIKHGGKAQQERGSACGTLFGTVSNGTTVRTEIGRRQGDMLHGDESHGFT